MQRTIVIEYKEKEIVSQPFTFKHACIVDDEKFQRKGNSLPLASGARKALISMFEGTTLTEEIIDSEIDHSILRKAVNKIINMYLGIDEELKNS